MTSISGLGSNAWATAQSSQTNRQARMQERMFQKTDSDGSGGVDATELQATLDKVVSKSGISIDTTAADLLTQADANGDGSLSSDELGTAMQSVLPPPPSTMDFAQSRSAGKSGGAGDDLFGKVDTDSSGTLDETELQTLLDHMANGPGSSTTGTTETDSTSSTAAADMLAALDTDGDGSLSESEFDAGRPDNGGQGGGMAAMGANRPPPPPGGMGGAGGVGGAGSTSSSSSTSTSTTYDPLDTNEDGVVSALERAAANTETSALDKLFSSADADSDGQLSKTELTDFVQQLAEQLTSQYTQVASGNFSDTTGQTVNVLA